LIEKGLERWELKRAPEGFAVLEEVTPEAEYLVNFDPSKISREEQTYFSYGLMVLGVRALSESFLHFLPLGHFRNQRTGVLM
jgi:hypothetical protein